MKTLKTLTLLVLLTSILSSVAQVIPLDRLVEWTDNVGVKGGIPNVTTIYTNFPNPVSSAVISSALRSCPPNQVVQLGAWTSTMSGTIDWIGVAQGVILRGTTNQFGKPLTKLVFGTGIMYMRAGFNEGSLSTEANLVDNAVKGNATINLGTVPSWVLPGHLYIIDQIDDTSISINPGQESGTSYRQSVGNGARGMGQIGKVISKTASTVTFEVPMYHPWSVSRTAQIAQAGYNPTTTTPRRYNGLENLILTSTSTAGDNHMVRMENADSCWVKNCEIDNIAGGIAVKMDFSYRCEVRDSYIHDSHLQGAGQGYGVGLYSVSCGVLVENNIFRRLHVAMQNNYGSSGNVYAYNLCIEGISDSGQNPSFNAHGTTGFQTLVEGNYMTNKILGDFTHGAGALYTVFRNRVVGYDPGETLDQAAISIEKYERKWNVVGNILGSSGWHNIYEYTFNSNKCVDTSRPIYKLGYFVNWACSTGSGDTSDVLDLIRALNRDTLNGMVLNGFTQSDLVNSYYLKEKPVWFGNRPWPPFNPFDSTEPAITNLPAGYRYVFGVNPPQGTNVVVPPPVNTPPVIIASANPTIGLAPLTVQFSNTSYDAETNILTYLWSFNDGTPNDTSKNVSHTFNTAGTFVTKLLASDGVNTSQTNLTIVVTNSVVVPPPTTNTDTLVVTPKTGPAPLTVKVTLPKTVLSYGDGIVSSNINYTYQTNGKYVLSVAIDVTNVYSATITVGSTTTNIPTVSTNGLVAAYNFDEGTGTSLLDRSTNRNNGTIANGIWSSGKYGQAITFNGVNSIVTIANAPSLNITNAITIEAWVYPTSITPAWKDVVFKANDIYFLMGNTPSGYPAFSGTWANGSVYSGKALLVNTWTHLAATYNGSTMKFYTNGVLASSRAQTGKISTSTLPLSIGGDSIYGQYWNGKIDNVRIYNRALSDSEILIDRDTAVK